jgi:olfactory receptor
MITVPKMLSNIWTQYKATSYIDCLTQVYFVLVFVGVKNFLFVAMAYDYYAAICQPLRYTWFCVVLVLFTLSIKIVDALLHSLMVLQLSFCTNLEIPHFLCELAQVLKIACSDTLIDNILMYIETCIFGRASISGILFSYFHIVSSVLRILPIAGKYKAFSTCGSHFTVVSLFYGSVVVVDISSAVTNSPRKSAVCFSDVFHFPSNAEPIHL